MTMYMSCPYQYGEEPENQLVIPSFAASLLTNRLTIMLGKEMSAKAKMRGITPDPEMRMGMTEDWPPYIFLPFTCFA